MGQVCLEVYLHCPKNVSRTLLELFYPVHVIDKMSTVIFFCRALPIIQSISNIKQWHFFCTFKSTFVISESFKTNKGNFCYNKIIFVLPFEALAGVCSRGQVTWLRSLLDWICQSKWDQICPLRGSACWAVCNESFWSLQIQNWIIFDRVVEINVLQRLGILIKRIGSIAVSNFSSDGYFDFWDIIWSWLNLTASSQVIWLIFWYHYIQ